MNPMEINREKFRAVALMIALANSGCVIVPAGRGTTNVQEEQTQWSGSSAGHTTTPYRPGPTAEGYYGPVTEGYYGPTTEGYYGPVTEGYYGPTTEGYYGPTTEGYYGPVQEY
jgi:hypothetical protein